MTDKLWSERFEGWAVEKYGTWSRWYTRQHGLIQITILAIVAPIALFTFPVWFVAVFVIYVLVGLRDEIVKAGSINE